jgi:hypothetical protein
MEDERRHATKGVPSEIRTSINPGRRFYMIDTGFWTPSRKGFAKEAKPLELSRNNLTFYRHVAVFSPLCGEKNRQFIS